MIRRLIPRSVEELAEWYMRYISPLSLIAGFIADNLFLTKRVDLFRTNALLFSYLVVAALCIVFINLIQNGHLRRPFFLKAFPLLPVVAQFAFGGLFSGYLSLYSRSAAFAVSWIFVLGLFVLIIANERFSHFYSRFLVQVSLYFTVLFSFLIFFLPVLFKQIGPWMFAGSGALALAIMLGFLAFLFYLVPATRQRRNHAFASIICIYLVFNLLYFTNAIPPLPLSLKSAGVYHSVVKNSDDSYTLEGEALPWYEQFLNYAPTFHRAPGEAVYAWSSIFAPSGLSTEILHQWQHYDTGTKSWVTTNTVSFPIEGGRDGGYRGYSEKINPEDGAWRVNIITGFGQLVGRISFTVVDATATPPLITSSP